MTDTTQKPETTENSPFRRRWQGFNSTAGAMFLVVLALIAVFSIISPGHAFFQADNFKNLALESTQLVLLAVGMTFVLSAGELDLSVGANVILSSVLGAKVMGTFAEADGTFPSPTTAILAGLFASLLAGLAMGLLNGLLVTVLKLNSFIVTLATTGLFTGVAYVVTKGSDVSSMPTELQEKFGVNTVLGVPIPALIAIVAVLGGVFVLHRLRFGTYTLALGSNQESARRAGIRVDRHRVALFAGLGTVAGMVGFIDLSRFLITNISGHQTDALAAISAVVIGGTSLFGGRGSIIGSLIGAFIPAILTNGLIIMRVDSFYQLIAVAIILIIAVSIDQQRRKRTPVG